MIMIHRQIVQGYSLSCQVRLIVAGRRVLCGINVVSCTACDSRCNACVVKGAGKCDENKCKVGFGLTPTFVCDREYLLYRL